MFCQQQRAAARTTRNDGTVDYNQLDRPTYLRQQDTSDRRSDSDERIAEKDVEYLDIPAFLRRSDDS